MRAWEEYADRLYLKPAGPAHIVPWSTGLALCGAIGSDLDWFGTGDWDEREYAAGMALCPTCLEGAFPSEDPAVADWRQVLTTHPSEGTIP